MLLHVRDESCPGGPPGDTRLGGWKWSFLPSLAPVLTHLSTCVSAIQGQDDVAVLSLATLTDLSHAFQLYFQPST